MITVLFTNQPCRTCDEVVQVKSMLWLNENGKRVMGIHINFVAAIINDGEIVEYPNIGTPADENDFQLFQKKTQVVRI